MTTPLTDAQILDADAETAELLSAQAQAHALLADAGRVPGLIAELAAAHELLGEWQVRVVAMEAAALDLAQSAEIVASNSIRTCCGDKGGPPACIVCRTAVNTVMAHVKAVRTLKETTHHG